MEPFVEALGAHHDLDDFVCEQDDLTSWLINHARIAAAQHTGRTFVLVEGDSDNSVIGYFTLSMHSILAEEVPRSKRSGSLSEYPAVLLGKLAIHADHKDEGLGTHLLIDSLRTLVKANEFAAARLVVVDPISERAARFYRNRDFHPLGGGSLRLFRMMKDVISTLLD